MSSPPLVRIEPSETGREQAEREHCRQQAPDNGYAAENPKRDPIPAFDPALFFRRGI